MAIDPAEVQASVDKIVPGFVRYPYDRLGNRGAGRTYDDFRNAVLGAFLGRDGAPFYVVLLGRDRLLELTANLKEKVAELSGACVASARRVQPVSRTSTLSNARVALDALAASMAERTGVYQSIATIPSFKRFENNVDQFLADEGKKARYRGELTDTPQQAKARIRPLAVEVRNDWDELLTRVRTWATSIDSYTALNLPSGLSQTILQNSSALLQSRVEELDALTPEQRLSVLREVVVDLVAAKATVRGFGSLEPPTTFLLINGVAAPFADATHPAVPARLPSDFYEGYSVYSGQDTLQLLLDGVHALTLNPPGSYVARHDCQIRGPVEVLPAANTVRLVRQKNDGSGYITTVEVVGIPTGAAIEPWQVVDAVNVQTTGVEAGLFHVIPKTGQGVSITRPGGGTFVFEAPLGVDFNVLGVVAGDTVIVTDPTSAFYNSVFTVGSIGGSPSNSLITSSLSPIIIAPNETGKTISVGADADIRYYMRLRDVPDALAYRTGLRLEDQEPGSWAALGFYATSQVETHRTPAARFAQYVNQSVSSATLDGVPRLSAETEFVPTIHTGLGRTHPEDGLLASLYKFRGEVVKGSVVFGTTELISSELAAAVDVGDVVVIRATNSVGDTNTWGFVVSKTSTAVIVPFTFSGTGSALVEAGRSLWQYTDVKRELELVITDGSVNEGVYGSDISPTPTPLDLRLRKSFPGSIGLGGQPVFFQSVQLGQRRVVLRSQNSTLTSAIRVTGTGNFDDNFVSSTPRTVNATTTWVRLPEVPRRLEAGDVLEVHNNDPLVPDLVVAVQSVDVTNKLIELVAPIDAAQPAFSMSVTSTLPFARIRKTTKQNFDDVAADVQQWLELPVNNTLQTFRNLDAGLNPVLANNTPSMAQVNVPKVQLTTMYDALEELDGYLAVYNASVVEEVDTLIKGYLQKGLDRAVDVLLSGDFATFFGMDVDDASYSTYLQKTLREVQKDDFPVRKDNRVNFDDALDEQVIAQFDDVDFDYTPDQLDPDQRIDINEPASPTYVLPTP